MTDTEIVALFTSRDEEALLQTERQYGSYCRMIAQHMLRDRSDAEECVNDAYYDAWNTIPPQKPQSFKAYIGALCRHRAIDRIRNKKADRRSGETYALDYEELKECIPSEERDIADLLTLRDALNRFLGALTQEARIIFMQRYWYNCSIEEIARKRGLTEGAVKNSLLRSRSKLRGILKKEGF